LKENYLDIKHKYDNLLNENDILSENISQEHKVELKKLTDEINALRILNNEIKTTRIEPTDTVLDNSKISEFVFVLKKIKNNYVTVDDYIKKYYDEMLFNLGNIKQEMELYPDLYTDEDKVKINHEYITYLGEKENYIQSSDIIVDTPISQTYSTTNKDEKIPEIPYKKKYCI